MYAYNRNENGILRSRDSGMTWQPIGTGVLSSITQLLTTTNAIFAIKSIHLPLVNGIADATQTIFRSTDDGATWQQIASLNNSVINWTPNGSTVYAFIANQTIAANGQTLVAVAQGQGIMRSEDNGTTWQNVTSMPATSYYTSVVQANNQFFITERSSSDTSTRGVRIFRSSDGGKTWLLTSSPRLFYVEFSQMLSVGSVLLATDFKQQSSENVLRSTDNGASWSTLQHGYENNTFVWAAAVVKQTAFLGTFFIGVIRSLDNGRTWTRSNRGLLNMFGGFTVRGRTLYMTTNNGTWRTDDKGETWTELTTAQEREGLFGYFASLTGRSVTDEKQPDNAKFAIVNLGSRDNELKRTADSGKTWATVTTLRQIANSPASARTAVSFLTVQNPQTLYVGIQDIVDGNLTNITPGVALPPLSASASNNSSASFTPGSVKNSIYRSTNDGGSWEQIQLPVTNARVSNLYATASELYVLVDRIIYRSTDKGNTWKAMATQVMLESTNTNSSQLFIYDLLVKDATLYITTSHGVYYSMDNGDTFRPMNLGLPRRGDLLMSVGALAAVGGTLFVATENGVFRFQLPPTLSARPQLLSLGNTVRNGITTSATFTVTGANLSVPVSITAPLGVLLFNPTTRTWGQTLTISTNSTDIVIQQVSVRLDSSRVGLRGRVGAFGQQAFISVSSGNLSANVEISGNVQEPPMLSVQPTALTFGTARVGNAEPFILPLQRSYTVTGTNLSETLIITAPDGVLLFDTVSNSWQQTLRFPLSLTPFTANFHTTLQARMDSSQVRNIAATILHRSGTAQASTQATLSVSGAVIPRPLVQVSPQSLTFADVVINTPAQQQQYTIAGTNLPAPVIVTAPDGILLWNTATASWVQTLTIATNASGSVAQTIAVRLDSSRVRTFSAEAISHSCCHSSSMQIVAEAFVQVRGAVVPLFLPANTETQLEMRLLSPRQPMLIRDTARVQLWLKDIRLTSTPSLRPRIIGQFLRNLRATLRLDTNNMAILGVVSGTGTRARLETAPQVPRTSALTTILIERTDTTSTSNMLLAELLLQATVSATTTNTIRAAEPTAWLDSRLNVAPAQVSWQPDFLNVSIRPLFAPRRTTTLAAVIAPNPSEGAIELRYKVEDSGLEKYVPLTLVVSDMAGRVVLSTELGLRKTGEMQQERINLHRLPVGVYQILIHAPNETINGRVEIRK